MEHPELGQVTLPGIPVKFPTTPGAVRHLPSDDCVVPVDQVWLEAGPCAAIAGSEDELSPLPLAGLRVVDLCTFLAGPIASAILADHGADVVKVEGPTGDAYRVYSLPYLMVNQRKRAVALDLTRPEGRAALLDIVRRADVLVDNLRPSSLERLGLGSDVLAAANPCLVRASVSAYGHEGAFADLPGFDPVMQALSGLASAQGGRGAPVATTAPVVDACTGAIAALGILGALFVRGGEAGAQRVTTSLAAVSTFLQSAEVTGFAGRPPNLEGGVDFPGPDAGHRYYRCRDGWLAVAATTAAQRTVLLEVVGHPEWSGLDRLVEDLATREVDGLIDELAVRHVPAARVLDRHGELHDPFLVENRFSHVVAEPTFGRARVVRAFADWGNAADPPMRGGVVIGEDTRAVLEEAGYDADAIERLLAGGAAISPKS
jgi:crotonobetainyl-CoA:carnitine CoA-transferase CaiB-like acyl-CoA transferase